MWNPFKAVASGIVKAGKAVGNFVSKPFTQKEKAPKAPPAPTRPPVAKAPSRQGTRVMPTVHAPAPAAPPKKERKLPPSMVKGGNAGGGRGTGGGMAIDEAILGADSDQERMLLEAVKEFESEHSMLGLNRSALDFLNHPSFTAIFDKYSTGSGFSTEQWIAGMDNIRNIQIARSGNGIKIIFDADFVIDDYELGGRRPYASF
jgi:hypothetical protein